MNRRTLDTVLPMFYVAAILIAAFIGNSRATGATAAVGGILIGAYWAGFRQNLKK